MEHLTLDTFKSKVFNFEASKEWSFAGDLPCIIDFYADWCGPCKMLSPTLEALSKEYEGKVNFYKINTDQEQELSAMFGIQSVPTLLFVPKNAEPQMAMGALPKKTLEEAIAKVLNVA